ncbi:MAG: tetratricopeptide repeat protein [Acidobacteriia bacterium]|nr:tetratricopeptide repeat protein [Terriglobia bacterium]
MSFSMMRKAMGALVVATVVISLEPAFAQNGGLTGKCVGEDGKPLVGYNVMIERQEVKGVFNVKTDKKGEYIRIGLPIGPYKVTLQDPNGHDVFFLITHVSFGDNTECNFDLAKERAFQKQQKEKEIAANPELKKRQEEQEKETKQFTGLKQIFDQGNVLLAEQKYPEAAQMFEQALPLAKDKNVPVVLGKLGESYQKARQYPKAAEDYEKAVALRPDEPTFHNNLGSVYAEMGKTAEAAAEFKKAAELDPAQASRYYYNYGAVMYNQGKMDDAAAAQKGHRDRPQICGRLLPGRPGVDGQGDDGQGWPGGCPPGNGRGLSDLPHP